MFMASRAATAAPSPSPFDAAVDRALSETADSEWGVMHRITRSFSADVDLAGSEARRLATAAERGGCGTGSLGSLPAAGARTCMTCAGVKPTCVRLSVQQLICQQT